MYGPTNLSELSSVSIRRLAWALGANMGKAIEAMVLLLPSHISTNKVCAACKDTTKCLNCVFKCGAIPSSSLKDLIK